MATELIFYAKQLNHGQSEVWLVRDDGDIKSRRVLATNEVNSVVRRNVSPEIFQAFYAEMHTGLGHETKLLTETIDTIATELRLQAN